MTSNKVAGNPELLFTAPVLFSGNAGATRLVILCASRARRLTFFLESIDDVFHFRIGVGNHLFDGGFRVFGETAPPIVVQTAVFYRWLRIGISGSDGLTQPCKMLVKPLFADGTAYLHEPKPVFGLFP